METSSQSASDEEITCEVIKVTIGIGTDATISKDLCQIYFQITTDDALSPLHFINMPVPLKVFDRNTTLSVQQDESLEDLQELASKLPWTNALKVWKLNTSLKKNRRMPWILSPQRLRSWSLRHLLQARVWGQGRPGHLTWRTAPRVSSRRWRGRSPGAKVLKFRVPCSRAGEKYSFFTNETGRDFCDAMQDFKWKADMTKFDVKTRCSGTCHLPMRTSSLDIIITDMPFGKRSITLINYLCNECFVMGCICLPHAISRIGGLWRNVGGLHAGVFLLKQTAGIFEEKMATRREWERAN
uniref:THUMP domain-containing protein n=1 Tax=Hucho hucho TaxID=62062 RepID=A0A4W5R6G6_9TELE